MVPAKFLALKVVYTPLLGILPSSCQPVALAAFAPKKQILPEVTCIRLAPQILRWFSL